MRENDENILIFKEIMEKIRNNSHDGLELFHKTYGRIIASVSKIFKNSDYFVKEVESCVVVKVWEMACKNVEVNNPGGWIYIVTKHCVIDLMNEEKYLPLNEYVLAEATDDISQVIEGMEFLYYIKILSEKEQQVMLLRYVQKYTLKEIADDMRKPLSTVASIHDRAKVKIDKWLQKRNKTNE